ncbi:MAG: sulfite dehydrogenase [Fulvimarina manganoxydans]|uniref:sulfite dehydrogenase n=1 Tax=Fulvimarina manganoxydans TaxID=937218 RepID=UPI0023546229|nr:sulfite dehydrogenase [Fulvimarina manganoxydans]MCK5931023.1 sulfite dehydrogenase [Fulvimarina manganoxydans]
MGRYTGDRVDNGRRRLLATAAIGGAGLLTARDALAQAAGPLVPQTMLEQGQPILSPPYGVPSKFEDDVVRRPTDLTSTDLSSWSFTPLQDLHGTITPNGLFYERHHAGVPAIDPDTHKLMVHGLVDNPLVFTMNDLMRMPALSVVHFLECSGNSLTEFTKPASTVQTSHGLLSCVEWTGVRLSTLLDAVGVKPEGKWILAEGADGAAMTRSLPIEKALDDALIAFGQNGEALRPEQGYPVRLMLPGYEGNMSIKWLRRLKVADAPFMTREETSKYTDLMPDGRSRQFTYLMQAKSVITSPAAGGMIEGGPGPVQISGIAWSGAGRIRKVDVSVDGGRSWMNAPLDGEPLPKALVRFRLPWQWDGAPTIIASRATDETGYVQPTREDLISERGTNYVYHYNAIAPWKIGENGEVTNAYASEA